MPSVTNLTAEAIDLLKRLIATPSLSKSEDKTADLIAQYLADKGFHVQRQQHNVWVKATNAVEGAPVLLLNSHHDTVKPNKGWVRDPFAPTVEGDQLFGLGSNDAGASAVSLIATFCYLAKQESMPVQLVLAITAEEENSGVNGIRSILPVLGKIDCAIVGEPTAMELAIAEKGLLVLDVTTKGKAGHAAREEGVNALYLAMDDIQWFRNYQFEHASDFLGPVKMSVTQIQAGYQHNVVPDECKFVVDVRTNEYYSNAQVLETIRTHVNADVQPRSTHLNSSKIALNHPLIQRGIQLERPYYGSPTMSDQAMLSCPSLKMGPGMSARSHTPDEFIMLSEIEAAIPLYIKLLSGLEIPHWHQD